MEETIDREGAVPLYHQIYLQLRDEILSGRRPHGSALPTELELAVLYSVSRITARRVLMELAQHNYVERKRRRGTRVIFQSANKPIEANIDQAVDSLLDFGRRTTVNVLEVGRQAAPPVVAHALHLKPHEEVVRAVRVRSIAGEPLGYILSYVPLELEHAITAKALARAPILAVLEQAGRKVEHATQTISAMEADGVMAQALAVEARSALLRITRTSFDRDQKPFLQTFAHYRADKFTIRLDLQHLSVNSSPSIVPAIS